MTKAPNIEHNLVKVRNWVLFQNQEIFTPMRRFDILHIKNT